MKRIFMFAGQGVQEPGMCLDVFQNSAKACEVLKIAKETTGIDVLKLCSESTSDELDQIENSCVSIVACQLAIALELVERGILPDAVAGFSLGEFSALTIAGVIDLRDVFPIVQARSKLMKRFSQDIDGIMAACGDLPVGQIEELCKTAPGTAMVVNYNSENQVVVSGDRKAVEYVVNCVLCQDARATILNISIPSHSVLMSPVADAFYDVLDEHHFNPPSMPIYMNYTGNLYAKEPIAEIMSKQICNPINWIQLNRKMYEDGFMEFVEVGPGKTLSKLVKRNLKGRNVTIRSVSDWEAINNNIV